MLTRLKSIFRSSRTRPVFIIGTGRSGTHWVANTLQNHPDILTSIEEQPIFGLSQQIAMNPTLEVELFRQLVLEYKNRLSSCSYQYYLDKSHPNIWIAEKLKNVFPEALFIGIQRNPFATVASMLRHKGVLSWHHRWREFSLPNRFLGITVEQSNSYDSLPIESQCAMRWMAHKNRLEELENWLGKDLLLISYESFQCDTDSVVSDLRCFLGLQQPLVAPHIRRESLDGWKKQLSSEQILHIQKVVGYSPEMLGHV